MKFTKIPEAAFQELQLNAGMLLREFNPKEATVEQENIVGATTGGVSFTATPEFSDFAEDIDNAPLNMLEFKKLNSWTVEMSGTFVTVNATMVKDLIAASDVDKSDPTKIVPRNDVLATDYKDIWWVGDYSDKNGEEKGGFLAIHMLNALSTGGFQLQSANNGKGNFAFTFMGHYSVTDQSRVPFEVFVVNGENETEGLRTSQKINVPSSSKGDEE